MSNFADLYFDSKGETEPEFLEMKTQFAVDFDISQNDVETLIRGLSAIGPLLKDLPQNERRNLMITLGKLLRERPDAPIISHVTQFQSLVRKVHHQKELGNV